MLNKQKKIIRFLCSVAFCAIIAIGIPQMVKAAETETFNGASGKSGDLDWEITKEGHLTVTGNGDYKCISVSVSLNDSIYTVSAPEWVKYYEYIHTAKIDVSNITSTKQMLYCCINLNSLDLSKLDTSNVTDMSYMFYYCTNLSNLDLSNFDTSNVTDMQSIFQECNNLQNLDLSNFDTSKVTSMRYMFGCCKSLRSLNISSFYTSNVTNMDYIFQECNSLQVLNLSNFDTSSVTSMGLMFNNCSSLRSLNLSNFNTSKVTSMYGMFSGCSSLQSLDLSGFDTSNVIHMFEMFYKCSSLQSLDLSNFDTHNVKGFYGMYGMFWDCSNLSSLNLSNFDTSNVTTMSVMFDGCSNLQSLDLSSFDTSNVTNFHSMFYGCSSLQSLDISSFDTSNTKNMMYMFCNCSSLNSLNLSNFNTSNVTNMKGMFFDCSCLKKLDLSNFNTGNAINMQDMFAYCMNLSKLDISNFNTNNVTSYFSLADLKSLEKLYFFADSSHEYALPTLTGYHWINENNATCTKTAKLDIKITYTRVDKDYIPVVPYNEHIFSDYNYTRPVTGPAVIYGNGISKTINSKKVNNKALTLYTDIMASYNYKVNNKGIVKPSAGKVIVGITKSSVKPEVNSKNKVTDTSASKIARAKVKNSQITVTAVGKESGLVYLWVIDTGSKKVSACCPINVKLAPKKLEVQGTTGTKLANPKLGNGKTLDVHIAGLSGSVKTDDCTYTATVGSKYQTYVQINPKGTTGKDFTITAKGLKNNKDTKAVITFTCNQNGKKAKFSLTITK